VRYSLAGSLMGAAGTLFAALPALAVAWWDASPHPGHAGPVPVLCGDRLGKQPYLPAKIAGYLFLVSGFGGPLLIGGILKTSYELALPAIFSHVLLPEERPGMRS
jgi:hypothetical protein